MNIYEKKANELIEIFREFTPAEEELEYTLTVKCAIACVDQIIDALENYDDLVEKDFKEQFGVTFFSCELQNMDTDFRYWSRVKRVLLEKQEKLKLPT